MKKKVGLALGSGGPRGLAHIGVIKALEENHISIDIYGGTSAGSMVAGLYLALGSIEKVEQIFIDLKLTEIATTFSDIGLRTGIIKGEKLEKYFDKYLGGIRIEELAKPLVVVTTKITDGEEIEITNGQLAKAIRASSSLPGFLDVARWEQEYVIDGGVSQPVPIRAVKAMGADMVIAINLDGYAFTESDFVTKRGGATRVGMAAIKLLRYSLAQAECRAADVVIEPDVATMNWINLASESDRREIIQRGYEATMARMDEIEKLVS